MWLLPDDNALAWRWTGRRFSPHPADRWAGVTVTEETGGQVANPSKAPSREATSHRWPGPWLMLFTFVIVTATSGIASWKLNDRPDRLSGPQMIAARLQDAQFPAARLAGAVLHGAIITGADFTSADLELAQLDGVTGTASVFTHACLRRTSWNGAELQSVSFDRADLRGAD